MPNGTGDYFLKLTDFESPEGAAAFSRGQMLKSPRNTVVYINEP